MSRALTVAASGAALVLLGSAPAPADVSAAAACGGYDYCLSTTNGSATVYLEKLAGGAGEVCDDASDGMRAKATVSYNGQTLNLRTASGFGSCGPSQHLHPTPARSGTYTW
jgi:hypothetical protein